MADRFETLRTRLQEIYDLKFAKAVLDWDMNTYMPPKGSDARSRQMALLAELAHQKLSSKELGELLAECGAQQSATPEQKAIVREVTRDRDKAVKIPSALVRELAETTGHAYSVWVAARKRSDFASFAPVLKKIIGLKKQEAHSLGFGEGVPYDALLDQFEPGATVRQLNPIISKTRDLARATTQAISQSKRKPKAQVLKGKFPIDLQEKFAFQVISKMGFDFQAGRLDRAVHPFCTNFDLEDVRITTRYDETLVHDALFSTIHESGHALYEMGMQKKNTGTPLAEAVSMGFHESQSRLWENQIGRSHAFWRYFFPKLQASFPKELKRTKLDDFHFAINAVKPSLIRVDADEVTYNLHIVVRYELEQALFADEISVEDLPELWNKKMKEYLGVVPKKAAEGVLQDIHWSFGGFGYFPTYLLGNLYSAQWMATMRKQIKGLDSMIARGNLLPIKKWLNENIHQYGRMYPASELVQKVSGEPLNPEYFGNYLKEKFGELYDV